MAFESDEVGRAPAVATTLIAAILKDLFKRSSVSGCEKEGAHGLVESMSCRFWCGTTAHDIERHGMSHVLASLFPDVNGRLQVHPVILAGSNAFGRPGNRAVTSGR